MKKNLNTIFTTRQYMLSEDFEIYYYNDKNYSGVNSHSHNYYEFYIFLEGYIQLTVDEHFYTPIPGDISLSRRILNIPVYVQTHLYPIAVLYSGFLKIIIMN